MIYLCLLYSLEFLSVGWFPKVLQFLRPPSCIPLNIYHSKHCDQTPAGDCDYNVCSNNCKANLKVKLKIPNWAIVESLCFNFMIAVSPPDNSIYFYVLIV